MSLVRIQLPRPSPGDRERRIAFVPKTIPEFADTDGQLAGEARAATDACGEMLSLIRLANVWDPNQQVVGDQHITRLGQSTNRGQLAS